MIGVCINMCKWEQHVCVFESARAPTHGHLQTVAAGLVHRFTGGNVGANRSVAERRKLDVGALVPHDDARRQI